MNMLIFDPLDTLFFRDGRPYNQGEQQADVESLFPPPAPTLIGAVRAALARGQGWRDNQGNWPDSLQEVLGSSHDDLGQLVFAGPYLARRSTLANIDTTSVCDLLFPAPAHLLRCKADTENSQPPLALLQPGPAHRCDLADQVSLPSVTPGVHVDTGGWKSCAGQWLMRTSMAAVLAGNAPDPDKKQILESKALWRYEPRTGNQRNDQTRTVSAGEQGEHERLYSSAHIRLERDIVLAMGVEGLPPQWLPQSPTRLGGEGRMAAIELIPDSTALPECPELLPVEGRLRYQVILITPMDINRPGWPTPENAQAYAGLPGKIISACTGRPTWIGGWNGLASKPIALMPHLPAGSVLYMETKSADLERVKALHGSKIGARTQWGFGQLLIGTWNPKE
jgi:CRISPR-associated protein Cmr3